MRLCRRHRRIALHAVWNSSRVSSYRCAERCRTMWSEMSIRSAALATRRSMMPAARAARAAT
eukprot:2213082-Pyramimonas_sp.AAC.1